VTGRFQRVGAVFAKLRRRHRLVHARAADAARGHDAPLAGQTPALAPYRHPILDSYRKRAHVLDEKGERMLSLAGPLNQRAAQAYEELSTSDIKFPT
jgi:oligoendopeptidase F